MDTDKLWILLGKKMAGEATDDELSELRKLVEASGSSEESFLALDKVWNTTLRPLQPEGATDRIWQNLKTKLNVGNATVIKPMWNHRRWAAVASLVLLLGTASLIYYLNAGGGKAALPNNVTTRAGSKTTIELPDGTQVWLNGNSRLTYKGTGFGEKNREVHLAGEAFFDVAKNTQVPFIIRTTAIDILVTGTAFNVKAYPSSGLVETALVRGSIEITTKKNPERRIQLKPNEKFVIALDSPGINSGNDRIQDQLPSFSSYSISKITPTEGRGPAETAWMNSQLVFTEDPFDKLATKLESWYNVRVHIEDSDIREKRFSGVVEKETLDETLKILQLSYKFRYTIRGNDVYITK